MLKHYKPILEPLLRLDLIQDMSSGDRPFSIILDESTDVLSEKHMAYVIRYYIYH